MVDSEDLQLEILREVPGRVILAERDGTIHLGRKYDIFRSSDDGVTWTPVTSLPRSRLRRVAEPSRLACRLLRLEVRALAKLSDGTLVAANREGVFYGCEGDAVMRRSRVEEAGLRLMPPMHISVGPGDLVLWGEYGSSGRTRAVRLFASRDRGRSFEVVRTLEAGSVVHVHNVVYDPHLDHFWVLAGDHGAEPGIGRLSADLERFDWLVKGDQRYRAVEVFDFGERLVYATDTETETNGLISLDKATGRIERVRDFDGSCIYACRYGGLYALSTSVEPSEVNRSRWVSLWLSRDGEHWNRAYRTEKDRWNADYFQFGSIVLPSGATDRELIFFSGQAVRGLDGKTAVGRMATGASL